MGKGYLAIMNVVDLKSVFEFWSLYLVERVGGFTSKIQTLGQ